MPCPNLRMIIAETVGQRDWPKSRKIGRKINESKGNERQGIIV